MSTGRQAPNPKESAVSVTLRIVTKYMSHPISGAGRIRATAMGGCRATRHRPYAHDESVELNHMNASLQDGDRHQFSLLRVPNRTRYNALSRAHTPAMVKPLATVQFYSHAVGVCLTITLEGED